MSHFWVCDGDIASHLQRRLREQFFRNCVGVDRVVCDPSCVDAKTSVEETAVAVLGTAPLLSASGVPMWLVGDSSHLFDERLLVHVKEHGASG